jgi:NADH dehydrogenase [ubiquinone] 1 alpha subcomplex assembly factor 5
MHLFDRSLLKQRRNRAAAGFADADFLLRESATRLADRLHDIQRSFSRALDLGCHHGLLAEALAATGKVERLIQCDLSEQVVKSAPDALRLVADEEFLPFAPQSLDAVFSNLSLHFVNDLPGSFAQIQRALKPDGLFLAVLPGPRTLQELRESLRAAAAETGSIAPRIAPFVEVRDAGALLQRAGFALPVIDSEILRLTYATPLALLRELQALGQTNILTQQHRGLTGKGFWPRVFHQYQQRYSDSRGRITATLELIFLTAWAPHASQQQPAKRGSGGVSLKDALI